MSRLCAKPTCSELAVSWLDIVRQDRRVIEHAHATVNGLAICVTHRDRFVVPDGWEIIELDPKSTGVVEPRDEASDVAPAQRPSSREFPWFLAGASDGHHGEVRPLLEVELDNDLHQDSLTAGSLLRRAFRGPDRDDDLQRQAAATETTETNETAAAECFGEDERYERETQQAIRALDEYGTSQLPFPPADAEPRAAVS